MNLAKKATSLVLSGAMLASFMGTVFAPAAHAFPLLDVTTPMNGAAAGAASVVGESLVSFTPQTPVAAGSTITVTLPYDMGLSGGATTAANWDIQQGTAHHAADSVAITGDGFFTQYVLTFQVNIGSIDITSNAMSIVGNIAGLFTAPTVVDYNPYQLCVATSVGDSGCGNFSIVPGTPTSISLSASPSSAKADGTQSVYLWGEYYDTYGNFAYNYSTPILGFGNQFNRTGGTVIPTGSWPDGQYVYGGYSESQSFSYNAANPAFVSGTTTFQLHDNDLALTSNTATVTWNAVGASVTCTPSGGTIASGSVVNCTYNAGSTGSSVSWSRTGYFDAPVTGGSGNVYTAAFTADNPNLAAGPATITANGLGGGSVSATFTYTVSAGGVAPPPIPPATPGTITATGNTKLVPRGGGWVDPLVYTFTEGTAGDWAAGNTVTVCFADKNGNPVAIQGGTLAGPDALGFTASSYSVSGNCFTVKLGSSDNTRLEAFTVSGLQFKAAATNVPGAISATYTDTMGVGCGLGPCAVNPVYFGSNAATATGTLAGAVAINATWITINLNAGSTPFVTSNSGNGEGKFVVNSAGANTESFYGTAGAPGSTWSGSCPNAPLASNQQCIHLATPAANAHSITEPVTQSVLTTIGTLPSPGTIVDDLLLAANSAPQLRVGVTNQTPGTVTLSERDALSNGLLAKSTVITLKVLEPGVLFSQAPTAVVAGGCGLTLSSPATLSLDRTSATFTVTAADAAGSCFSSITFSMLYDVASTATKGDAVNLQVTAGSIVVYPASVTNAYIGALIFTTSTIPTVYIGENDQTTGTVSIAEVAAGSIGSAAGGNTLYACLTTGEFFTRPPWMVVTAGDLMITNPNLLTGATKAVGTPVALGPTGSCYAWAVYTASTKPSTVQIQGVDASGNPLNNPHINVPGTLSPGPTYLSIGTMLNISATSGNLLDIAEVALRAFRSGITVTAASQPFVAPGTAYDGKPGDPGTAGDLKVAETANYQFHTGDNFVCEIENGYLQQHVGVEMGSANSNILPIVKTDGATTGLQASLGAAWATGFRVHIDQASTSGPGSITITNLGYTVKSDTPLGPILVECFAVGQSQPTSQVSSSAGADFDAFVSNAIVGSPAVKTVEHLSNDSAVGSTTSGPFSNSTKVVKPGTQVTLRFQLSPSFAGAKLGIWIATKDSKTGTWGSFKPHAKAYVDASGAVYYVYSASAGWLSFRAFYAGDATHAAAWSSGTQARWMK